MYLNICNRGRFRRASLVFIPVFHYFLILFNFRVLTNVLAKPDSGAFEQHLPWTFSTFIHQYRFSWVDRSFGALVRISLIWVSAAVKLLIHLRVHPVHPLIFLRIGIRRNYLLYFHRSHLGLWINSDLTLIY